MGSWKKTRIISDDGHFRAIIARLVEHPILEHHEYVWILFESGVKVPVVVLSLWYRALELLGDFPPFLLQMDGLMFIKSD